MPPKRKKGLAGVVGAGRALEADEQSLQGQEQQAPATKRARDREKPVYRGKARAEGKPLKTLSITLPADIVSQADMFVLHRKQDASGYNRSALVEEALRAFLEAQGK